MNILFSVRVRSHFLIILLCLFDKLLLVDNSDPLCHHHKCLAFSSLESC